MSIERSDVPADWPVEELKKVIRELLVLVGEDPEREGLERTPERVARMFAELTEGYRVDPVSLVNDALFDVAYDEMVVVRDIEFYSLCEHHLLPFFGQVHIGYIPDGRILGLSKFARLVDMYARRLQLQERLATQIAEALVQVLEPRGVGVVVEGAHLCMMMRGVEKQHSTTVTSAMRGVFKEDLKTREEFLALLRSQP